MSTISNDFAADIVASLRKNVETRDELTATSPIDLRDLLLIKLYDDLQALTKATAFLGGGIIPVRKVSG